MQLCAAEHWLSDSLSKQSKKFRISSSKFQISRESVIDPIHAVQHNW